MASAQPNRAVDPETAGLRWRFVGPYRGGRTMAVAGHPTERRVFFAGTSGGGIWRTDDAGARWRNVSDGWFRRASVGALAIADADPNVIYVGMGECGLRSNVTHGDGVYKSTDGGRTWRHTGLAATQNIAKVRVHPKDPDLVYVAAFGHRFGPNPERGVYRSRDGGQSWELLLHRGPEVGAIDLLLDPANTRVLYAATWQARIYPWRHATTGPGSTIYRSDDGGETWVDLGERQGFPAGDRGRIGIASSPGKAGRVWAIVDAEQGGIYRSDDGGERWTWLSDDRNFLVRAWYFGHLVADPSDPDGLYVVNRKLWRSGDGGRTYRQVNVPYVDEMDLWIDPADPARMILGNDGGVAVSFDRGETWSSIVNQPTAEIYRVAADMHVPYRIYGSQQDNSTLCLPSRSDRGGISQMDWYDVGGGESGFIAPRSDNPNIVFSSDLPGLGITRYDHATRQIREIGPWGEPGSEEDGRLRHRFNWSTPVAHSPHDPNVLYVGGNVLFRSTDDGASWAEISPDLTRNDREKIDAPLPGSFAVGENEANHYCTLSSVAESAHTRGILWTGSDDGLIHVSRDDGATWTNVTPPGLPAWSTTHVEPSPHAAGTACVAATAHPVDDFRPYVFRTEDFGATWTEIADGIPNDEFVRVVRQDPVQPGLLYAGTEVGVHVSLDAGAHWRPLQLELPIVAVHDLVVKDSDLVVGTHGRGMWVLDDVSPLRELARGEVAADVHLYQPSPVLRLTRQIYGLESLIALYEHFAAPNPPSGAVVHYRLGQPAKELRVELIDGNGGVVSEFVSGEAAPVPRPIGAMDYELRYGAAALTGTVAGEEEPGVRWGAWRLDDQPTVPRPAPTEAGLHRVELPITYPSATRVPGASSRGITAPLAVPGWYTVRLTVDGTVRERPIEIRPDPRVSTTPEAYRAQFELMVKIRDHLSVIHEAVIALRDVRVQIEQVANRITEGELTAKARGVIERLTAIERKLIQPGLHARSGELASVHFPVRLNNKLEALGYQVARSDDPPTNQAVELFEELRRRSEVQLDELRALLGDDVARLDAELRASGAPLLVVPPGI